VGVELVRSIPLICCAVVLVRITGIVALAPMAPLGPHGDMSRTEILRSLQNAPGEHLILVHYNPTHSPDREWVYNAADVDHAKVVWARDMGERDNLELLLYFRNRKVWRVNPDEIPTQLEPVSTASFVAGSASGEK
jgi:hypothetical protein